jgi:hypothetical protein
MAKADEPICTNQYGHEWGEWEQLGEITIWKDVNIGSTRAECFQHRRCFVCGYIQIDKKVIL